MEILQLDCITRYMNEQTSLLMNASSKGHVDKIKILIEHGADINAEDWLHFTPLMYASSYPILLAKYNRKLEVFKCLVEHGADINLQTSRPDTPLHMICADVVYRQYNIDIIKYLVENGADVNSQGDFGNTPLMKFGGIPYELDSLIREAFDYLVEHGADIQAKNNEGMTLWEWN